MTSTRIPPVSAPDVRRTPDSPPGRDPVDERLPLGRTLTLGLQHVLVMYAGVVAVPLVLAQALGLSAGQTVLLLNANLLVGGAATLVQTLGLWRFGARLPLVQGASFIALSPMLLIGQEHGLTTVFGSVIAAGAVTIAVAPFMSRLVRFFPPVVIGVLITVVGISLMPAAAGWLGGGQGSDDFGSLRNLLLGLLTVVVTVVLHAFGRGLVRSLAVLVALVVGTGVAAVAGATDFSHVADAGWFGVASPLAFGAPHLDLASVLVMSLAMLVILAETTGNVLAIGTITGSPITPRRLGAAFRADGLSTLVGGFLNGFPLNAFSQNTGLIAMTAVRSRFVVAAGGGVMIALGLFPKVGALVAAVPPAVLGGGAIVMFGMTTAAGIQELARVRYTGTNNALVVAVSVSVGVLPMAMPELFAQYDGPVALVLQSGIFLGAIAAVLLNLALNREDRATQGIPGPRSGEADDLTAHELDLLRRAMRVAETSRAEGRHPFGAIVVDGDGIVVAERGNNSLPPAGDPTQHAETAAVAAAARTLSSAQLARATLYTSAEPCAMCAGAVYWTGIGRVVYALSEERLLGLTGDNPENPTFALPCREVFARGQRHVTVVGPLLEEEAAAVHDGFWS
ncbi:solute carrier family 23 protein [Cellulomonas sp. PhB143]|uniref:solute carrier family 23 protein n=1 Tax=Cellulomonas sp. PhB143 TaxID=2485186 RepID=UPI000F49FFA1|nr:solute carrier family 23 protein [Cellulomonas sp. PhB143]ROS76754.1 NCS2 family nucleobase:cation symporter-2 [Cellulomonas sp. PhB143]